MMQNTPASKRHNCWPCGQRHVSSRVPQYLESPRMLQKRHWEEPEDPPSSFISSPSSLSSKAAITPTGIAPQCHLPPRGSIWPCTCCPSALAHLNLCPGSVAHPAPHCRKSKFKVKNMCLHMLLHDGWTVCGQGPVTSRERFWGGRILLSAFENKGT